MRIILICAVIQRHPIFLGQSTTPLTCSRLLFPGLLVLALCLLWQGPESSVAGPTVNESTTAVPSTRYGLFDLLDSRSQYGQGIFPEPFLVDDSDYEINEARLDLLHTKIGSQHSDLVTAEIEKGFGGILTLEIELPYEVDLTNGHRQQGFNNVDLGARVPVYQYVSDNSLVDSTFGVAFEAGIPTNSTLSKNGELVPKVFNDLRLGEHFTLQSILGYSTLVGPGQDGGLQTFEYGFVFGYTIPHEQLPIPGVLQVIPVFELLGETALNHDQKGDTLLEGNAAVRVNLKTIGRIQPRLGVGYVFPIDNNARQDLHWGIVTSLIFEY